MAEGLTGPGYVGRYFDHERISQGQMDGDRPTMRSRPSTKGRDDRLRLYQRT